MARPFPPRRIRHWLGFHEARVADLDGDSRMDILDKPYNWEAPRVDVWLQIAAQIAFSAASPRRSDPQVEFPPMHPEENQPEHEQDSGAGPEWLESVASELNTFWPRWVLSECE